MELNKDLMPSSIDKKINFNGDLTIRNQFYLTDFFAPTIENKDLNNYVNPGIYWLHDGNTHGPTLGPNYAYMLNLGGHSGDAVQVQFPVLGHAINVRRLHGGTGDNYETYFPVEIMEGTPTMSNVNVNYQTRFGICIKIGRLCFIQFKLKGTMTGGASGATNHYAMITGIPYAAYTSSAGSLLEGLNALPKGLVYTCQVVGTSFNLEYADPVHPDVDRQGAGATVGDESCFNYSEPFYITGCCMYYTA